MLHRVSYEFLRKVAVYGAVLSVSGCSVLYYLMQSVFNAIRTVPACQPS